MAYKYGPGQPGHMYSLDCWGPTLMVEAVHIHGHCCEEVMLRLQPAKEVHMNAHMYPSNAHMCPATGWALLGLMLRVCGCSLLPLLPTIARVLADLLRRVCVLGPAGLAAHPPAVRAAAYHAARAACEARGVGAVRLLGDACMGAVSVELYGWAVQAEGGAGGQAHHMGGTSGRSGGGSSKHAAKRAKLMGAAEAVESAE
eukprot:scaffold106148_cov27-Tisochrysis_lutea.AAC.1